MFPPYLSLHGEGPGGGGAGEDAADVEGSGFLLRVVLCSAPSVSQSVFTITEKAPTRAFSWLKAPTSTFTFKTLIRHYAEQALTPRYKGGYKTLC